MPKPKHNPQLLALIGKRLQQARVARALSQSGFAERIGIEPVTLCRYETGARGPSVTMLLVAADALGLRLADLVDDVKAPPLTSIRPSDFTSHRDPSALDDHHLDIAAGIVEVVGKRS